MPEAFKLVRVNKFVPPNFKMPRKVWSMLGDALEGGVIDNILRQTQATGAPIKRNRPGYRDMKQRLGWTFRGEVMSLVGKGKRLVRGRGRSYKKTVRANEVTLEPRPGEITEIMTEVHQAGYTGWFEISEKMIKAARAIIAAWVKEEVAKAKAKTNKARA